MGVDSRKGPPLPAPTETDSNTGRETEFDTGSRLTEKSTYSLASDGSPITIPTKKRDKTSAVIAFVSTLVLIPVSLLPTFLGFGGFYIAGVSILAGLLFSYYSYELMVKLDVPSARKMMFCSFFYIPLVQLVLLFDFIL